MPRSSNGLWTALSVTLGTVLRVGMAVRQQNRIETLQSNAEGLLTKVGRGVNHHVLAAAGDQHGGAQPLIARVARFADATRAPECGNAHGGARSKDCDF